MSNSFSLFCCVSFSLLEGTSGSNHRNMSSGAGGLGLEKNVLTQNSSGTYFSSCESKFPLRGRKFGKLWLFVQMRLETFMLYF